MALPLWAADTETINNAGAARVVKSAAITMSSGVVRLAGSLVSAVVLGRLLTPDDYGLVGMVMPLIAFAGIFSDGGVSTHTLQSRSLTQDNMSLAFWVGAVFALSMFLAMLAISPVVAHVYGDDRLLKIMPIIALGLLSSLFIMQHNALVKRCYRQKIFAISEICGSISGLIFGVSLALYGAGYWALVAIPLARNIAHAISIWMLTGWVPSLPKWELDKVKALVGFGGIIVINGVMVVAAKNFDKILLGMKYGAEELGYYAMAYSIMLLPFMQVLAPVGGAVVPYLGQIKDDPVRFNSHLSKVVIGLGVLVAPLMAFAALRSEQLLIFTLGEKWLPSVDVFCMLAIASIGLTMMSPLSWAMVACGKPAKLAKWTMLTFLPIIGSYLFGLPWGGYGVAFGFCSYAVIALFIFPYYASHHISIKYSTYVHAILKVILVTLLSVGVVFCVGVIFDVEAQGNLFVLVTGILELAICVPWFFVLVFGRSYSFGLIAGVLKKTG